MIFIFLLAALLLYGSMAALWFGKVVLGCILLALFVLLAFAIVDARRPHDAAEDD